MNASNPYAPPTAAVQDIETHGAYQPVRMWSAAGRIGRMRYLAHLAGAYFVMVLASFLIGVVSGILHATAILQVLPFITFPVYLLFFLLKGAQRSHDMDWSGWTALLTIIPFVGLVWVFKSGSAGDNSYGAPPPPNTLGVKILGLVFPVIMFVAIAIAVSVAIPAYTQYKNRALSGQTR
jgi:uncharacterized membrane protein YhaH (DUF805 family)